MDYRRPLSDDFEKMVILQNKNLASVLKQDDKADGFLSASFSAEQFKVMDEDLCVVICADEEEVCAYVCVSSVAFNQKVPLVAAMIERFPFIMYEGKTLKTYNHAISGPVCIDKEYRGKGILLNLYQQVKLFLQEEHGELDLFTVLIAAENERSVYAHKKLGMEVVGQCEFNSTVYEILVLPISKSL